MDKTQLVKCSLYFSIAYQASFIALGTSYDGALIQYEDGVKKVHPLFTDEFTDDIYKLIKRGYLMTSRGTGVYDYKQHDRLIYSEFRNFGKNRNWRCSRPCQGMQGDSHRISNTLLFARQTNMEVDYPCYVALKKGENGAPNVIGIIFRGSQGNKFEALGGFGGPSWLTNYAVQKSQFAEQFDIPGSYHRGILEKYESLSVSLTASLTECFELLSVSGSDPTHTRIVITGHSQGAGLAVVAAVDIVKNFCKKQIFGQNFDNINTPRVFVLAISGPNVIGDRETRDLFYSVVGEDNVIRYSSLFDIVPYSCPGERVKNSKFASYLLKSLLDVDSGYVSVGHLGLCNTKNLLFRGLERCNNTDRFAAVPLVLQNLIDGYKYVVDAYNSIFSIIPFAQAAKTISDAAQGLGGIHQFLAINHFGSNNADSSNYLFDPTLPEHNLSEALARGAMHNLILERPYAIDSLAPRLLGLGVLEGAYSSDI